VAPWVENVVREEQLADGPAQRGREVGGAEARSAGPPMPTASYVRRLQRAAGNRATIDWMARSHAASAVRVGGAGGRQLQRQPAATQELRSDQQAVEYAKRFAADAGKRSLTDETRRLFRYFVRTSAPTEWDRLGKEWTFDDYPFQDFTFAVMPDRAGSGFLLGIGPEFIKRIAAGHLKAVSQELQAGVKELDKRTRSPQLSGEQPAVSGLGPDRTAAVVAKIAARDPQGALNLLVRSKVQDGTIDPRLLTNGAMNYDPDLTEDGICSMQSWDYIANRAEPTVVRIGPNAFSSVSYLYSVVMHEYQHVLQRQSLANQQNEQRLRAQKLQSANEVEAYAWELMHASESGLQGLPNKVASVWGNLNEEYWKLDLVERAKVSSLARKARARAEAMVKGSGVTLVPFRAP
jgi:hypothetical protein